MLLNDDKKGSRIQAALAQCVLDSATHEGDISPVVELLRAQGWTDTQLHMNELPVDPVKDREMQTRFIATATAISDELAAAGIENSLFIKCRRAYELYWDTNIDVVVGRDNYHRVVDTLTAKTWLMPSKASKVDQFLIERGKLKLMPVDRSTFMAAHVYRALSWRYQESFLPTNAVERDLWHSLPVPSTQDDILLLVAHSVFENYRLTLGEVLHFALLQQQRPALVEIAREQGRRLGMETGVQKVLETAQRIITSDELYRPEAFPVQFDSRTMTDIMAERVACKDVDMSTLGRGAEAASVAATYGGLRVIREVRRRRRGAHGFRKDTKTRWV